MSEPILSWEPWSTPDPSNPNLIWPPPPAPVTAQDIREWEEDYGVRLPPILARALVVQNGGRVQETSLDIEPLENFSTLDEDQWAHVYGEGPLADLERDKIVHVGDATGCGIVLDYTVGTEPRILLVHHNVGGELQGGDIGSFEDLLRLLQAAAAESRRTKR